MAQYIYIIDGTFTVVENELLGSFPNTRSPKSPPPLRWKRPPIWSSCELYRLYRQGTYNPRSIYRISTDYCPVYSLTQRQRRKLWKPFRNNLPIWLNAPTPHRPRRASRRVPTTRSSWENTNQCSSKSISTLSFSRCRGSSCKRDEPHWMDLCCTVRTFIQIHGQIFRFLV